MTEGDTAAAPGTRVIFVGSRDEVPPTADGTIVVVTDTAWTPSAGERPDVLPLRPVIARIVERVDLFDDALENLDRWAAEAGVVERMTTDGVSIWYAIREPLWHWLHERMLWAHVIDDLARGHDANEFRGDPDQPALMDVLASLGSGDDSVPVTDGPAPASRRADPGFWVPFARLARRGRRVFRRSDEAKGAAAGADEVALDGRVRTAAAHGGAGVLVLSYTRVSQVVATGGAPRLVDPQLDSVIARLGSAGLTPILLGLGLRRGDPATEAAVINDERLLPEWLLSTRWGRGGPNAQADRTAARAIDDRLATVVVPQLQIAGVDLGPTLMFEARRSAMARTSSHERQRRRIDALITEIRPAAILMTHEGLRMTWLAVAAAHGIPTFAVQHGVIYPAHPGYRHPRHPGLVLPTRTFVYGPFERRTLLEAGGYGPDEVEVSGSPRLDLDRGAQTEGTLAAADRTRVRSELGVADTDRLLVVSTLFDVFIRWSHLTHMLERLLGGPLPRVHVAFKLHPGESDEGPYRALLEGMASTGGYEPPPISVIRDIDLYRLLRTADAHLGMHSTVLTDAVVAGTPNLIATVNAHTDILGYIPARVARPVASVAELLEALDNPWPPDAIARQAFLDEHSRSGDASGRIVDSIRQSVEPRPG